MPKHSTPHSVLAPPAGDDKPAHIARWGSLYGSAPALALVALAQRHKGPIVVLTADAREAEKVSEELNFYAHGMHLPVLHLPEWETLPYDAFSPHPDIVSTRVGTMAQLPRIKHGLLVLTGATAMQRLPPRSYIDSGTLQLRVGDTFALHDSRRRFEQAGYNHVTLVAEPGEYAVRGALVDLFPMGAPAPYRIDLFDDEIDSIRLFDPDTQRSGEKLEQVSLLPGREFPLTEQAQKQFRARYRQRFEGDPNRSVIYRDVSAGNAPGGVEYYLPLFFENTCSVFDYLPANALLVEPESFADVLARTWQEFGLRYEQLAHDIERPILTPEEVWRPPSELEHARGQFARVLLHGFELDLDTLQRAGANFASRPPPILALDIKADNPSQKLESYLHTLDGRALLVTETAGRREQLLQTLRLGGLIPQVVDSWPAFLDTDAALCVTVATLERGLHLPEEGLAVVVEEQLLGERARRRTRRRAEVDPEALIRDLTDLREGAPVVHEEYGIGRYVGLSTLDLGNTPGEFLTLEYAGGDKLYVPVHALHLITRYTGASADSAPLHRLGGDQWKKAKAKAAKKIRDVAAELLDIYAQREAQRGHAFTLDEHDYRVFSGGFPFEETPDQELTIEQVVDDMKAVQPMDRIVCGDVGFGKTEVAMRAAFVAVQAGKQVAVLVPTTLLAQQHYQNFIDRFADWAVNIDVLSRFRTNKQAAGMLTELAEGRLDIVIGTHRLLSGQVKFKNLGLTIIDEEQRFGVRHKEKLKAFRAQVDVLTLTATPIPRTLNMAMGGLRELSLITTPPSDRLAVKTFITQWNPTLIREALLREIRRGGQVYFVHNKVQTIEGTADELAKLVPEATIQVGHGQMRERDLERVMLDFYHRRFNTLVCSTIIESGIDVPTANTIVINRADRFGLAQLHQLRGRVGRSHHRAYAYMIAPPKEAMTADAIKRLEAIETLEELGSGFALATHDLEIRGAGELLGDEQSGQIQQIGFALYTELLARAVKALKRGEIPALDTPAAHGPEIEVRAVALLPDDYMPDVHMRLVAYKRIASADSDEALDELQIEMIDRFGLLPDPAKTLFRIAQLRIAATTLGIIKIDVGPANGRIVFGENAEVAPEKLISLLQNNSKTHRFDGQSTLRFSLPMPELDDRFATVHHLVRKLSP